MGAHNLAVEEIHFVDENGNNIKFNLESVVLGEGNAFQGYMVSPMSVRPDVDLESNSDAAWEKYGSAQKKIARDAEKYFKEHPEQAPKIPEAFKNSSGTFYTTEYLRLQATKEIRRRQAEGNATPLQDAYIYMLDNKLGKEGPRCAFAWEQLTGKMPLDAPDSVVLKALNNDVTRMAMREDAKESRRSIEAGRASLRVREQQQKSSITYSDGDIKTTVKSAEKDTYTYDEVNAMMADYIKKKASEKGK